MARQRFIWPDLWEDEDFGALSPPERILFIALFSLADDEGRLPASPANLRALAFRFDDYTLDEVRAMRDHIAATMRHVELYAVDGKEYIWLTSWQQRQHPKYPQPSRIPAPPSPSSGSEAQMDGSPQAVGVRSGNVEGTLEEDSSVGWVGLSRDIDKPPLPPMGMGGTGSPNDDEDQQVQTPPASDDAQHQDHKHAKNPAMSDPTTRRVVAEINAILDNAGVTARPDRWYPRACSSVHNLLARKVHAEDIIAAARWSTDPERRKYYAPKFTIPSRIADALAAWQARTDGPRVPPGSGRRVPKSRYLTPQELGILGPPPADTNGPAARSPPDAQAPVNRNLVVLRGGDPVAK